MPLKQVAAKGEIFAGLFQRGQFASRGNNDYRNDIGDRQSAIGAQIIQNAREELIDDRLARR